MAHRAPYLAIDTLPANPELVRRLPEQVAWQYHALPLAEDSGQITVAMADPDDMAAREAVLAALGPASYVIQGNPLAIDSVLREVWGHPAVDPIGLVLFSGERPVAPEVWDYAHALGRQLGADVSSRCAECMGESASMQEPFVQCDLALFADGRHRLIRQLLGRRGTGACVQASSQDTLLAVLVAHEPRWPIQRILLLISGSEADRAAVDWVVRLAVACASEVTVLATVPPVPLMYGRHPGAEQGLEALLTSATPLGEQLAHTAERLVQGGVAGTLRLRQGPPEWQICRELTSGTHDLIVLSSHPHRWWRRWLERDMVGPLICRADRPVLIARSAPG